MLRRCRIRRSGLSLPFDFGDLSDQVAHFVAIEFGYLGDPVDILHEVF
jgi:hypothetical protein